MKKREISDINLLTQKSQNNKGMNEKECLKKRLKEIEESEKKELIENAWEEFKELLGKCFRKQNTYGSPEELSECWWKYQKVVEISRDDLYFGGYNGNNVFASCRVFTFQKDSNGEIRINSKSQSYVHCLGGEIPEHVFNQAWNEIKSELNQL